MGEKNGISLSGGVMWMKDENDEYHKVGDIQDAETFTKEPEVKWEKIEIKPEDLSSEYSAEFDIHSRHWRKAINILTWGWKTKGPIRKRVLKREMHGRILKLFKRYLLEKKGMTYHEYKRSSV